MTQDDAEDENKTLFQSYMQSVTPLKKSFKRAPTKKSPPTVLTHPHTKQPTYTKPQSNTYLSNYCTEIMRAETVLSYCSEGISRQRLRQLKNGEISWSRRLDLHGLKPDDARDALCNFIESTQLSARLGVSTRCVLIIHGKGGRNSAHAILKTYVNCWLKQLPQILAFHSAKPCDGGTGAIYVLLKKHRD